MVGFKELQKWINGEEGVRNTKGIIKSTCDDLTFGKSSLFTDNASTNKGLIYPCKRLTGWL